MDSIRGGYLGKNSTRNAGKLFPLDAYKNGHFVKRFANMQEVLDFGFPKTCKQNIRRSVNIPTRTEGGYTWRNDSDKMKNYFKQQQESKEFSICIKGGTRLEDGFNVISTHSNSSTHVDLNMLCTILKKPKDLVVKSLAKVPYVYNGYIVSTNYFKKPEKMAQEYKF